MAICSILACVLTSAYAADVLQKRTATVFPFAYIGMDAGDSESAGAAAVYRESVRQHANDLYTLLNDGLGGSKYLSVVKFEPRLSAVQRAIKEQKFTEKEMLAPIDTTPAGAVKAQKLGSMIGAEIAIIGSVDKYIYRPDKGEVELTTTVQMVDVASGRVVEMFTATGRGARGADKDVEESAIGTAAAYDAAERLLADIAKAGTSQEVVASGEGAGFTPVATAPEKPAKKKNLLPAMLGALLVGFLISGGS